MSKAVSRVESGIVKLVDKARADVALCNPIGYLIRAMQGEEFDGETLKLRDRIEIAKFLGARILPAVSPEERGLGSGGMVTPPPLVINMYGAGDKPVVVGGAVDVGGIDSMKVVSENEDNERVE